jgi:hypothetical protein
MVSTDESSVMVNGQPRYCGWVKDEPGIRAYNATLPSGEDFWDKLRAADDGGDRFYYRAVVLGLQAIGITRWLAQRNGVWVLRSYNQGQIGSCVGTGEAKRQSYIAALDVFLRLDNEAFTGMFSPEWAYYASRYHCGMLNRGDGSTGFGAAKAAVGSVTPDVPGGSLVQGVYGGINVTEYSVSRCGSWGDGRGIPKEAPAEANQHRYVQYLKVDTAEKCWLLAGAGMPWNQCSDLGWETARDADGACSRRKSWNHSMCAGAARYTTAKGRKLVLIDQSWSVGPDDWTTGPYYGDQPWGSFFADLDDAGEAASQGDTFVDIAYAGDVLPVAPVSFTSM